MTPSIHDGLALHQAGKLREAGLVYQQILARNPNDADALHLTGVLKLSAGDFRAAEELISRAIRVRPSVAFYHNNLGNAQKQLGKLGEAEASYRHAISLQQNYADAWVNLGTTLRLMARFEEAVEAFQAATRINPLSADAFASLGTGLKDQGRMEEAISAYRRAVALNPALADAHANLAYALHSSDAVSPAEIFEEHRRWAAAHAKLSLSAAKPQAADSIGRRIRVGYVSADFREHPVARFLWPIVEHRDRTAFQVICFSDIEKEDAVTQTYRGAVDEWHDISRLDDDAAAELIGAQKIDVLVDLSGHTAGSRLGIFARKPAPVQVTYLGYPNTTGMTAIDLRIVDALTDPEAADQLAVERLARVDGCFLCYPLPASLPAISPLPAAANGSITFGSFNNLHKISPTTIRMWADVLRAVPTAKMIIKTTSLGDRGTMMRAAQRFAAGGLPMERVLLLPPTRTEGEHVAQYRLIDIALDTFPYCGTTTTCEALSMGVPVVSRFGGHHAARVGLSILSAAGHGGWATNDANQYVKIAADLAGDIPRLAEIRAGLRENLRQSVLCDGKSFAVKIEGIYRDAWELHRVAWASRPSDRA